MGEEEEEAQRIHEQIKDREAPLSRFGATDGENDGKENGDRNYGDSDINGKSLSILMDDLSLGVDYVYDPLGSMPTHRVELVRFVSSRKIHMVSGYISAHLISQEIWNVGSGTTSLFSARTRSRMNSIGSRISDEVEEE